MAEPSKGELFGFFILGCTMRGSAADPQMCPPDSPIWSITTDILGEDVLPAKPWDTDQLAFRLPQELGGFIHDHQAAMDLCQNPELRWQHGNFFTEWPIDVPIGRNRLYPGEHGLMGPP